LIIYPASESMKPLDWNGIDS